MAFKAILASMLLVQSALGQYVGPAPAPCGLAGGYGIGLAGGYGAGFAGGYGVGCGTGVASTGGGLAVSSVSPIVPFGVSVISENTYEGQLCAGGNLPFLSSVAIEGVLPTVGEGAVSYGCGDGAVGIVNEAPVATGILTHEQFAPSAALVNQGVAGYGGYGLGAAGHGYGAVSGYGLGGVTGYSHNGADCGCGYY